MSSKRVKQSNDNTSLQSSQQPQTMIQLYMCFNHDHNKAICKLYGCHGYERGQLAKPKPTHDQHICYDFYY